MPIANEAFLALEGALAAQVLRVVEAHVRDDVEAASLLAEEGKYDLAHDLVDSITLVPVRDALAGPAEARLVQGLLLGAQQLADLGGTVYETGEPLPDVLRQAVDQMVLMIEAGVGRAVRATAHAAVTQVEAAATGRQVVVAKGDLADAINAAVFGAQSAVVDIGANLTTSRVVSYGFLSQAASGGVQTYQVSEVLDSRTCEVCQRMHGRTFRVDRALERLDRLLRIADPDELKGAAPWPSGSQAGLAALDQLSSEEMQARGFDTPPYHPNCRGILVARGSVQPLTGIAPPRVPAGQVGETPDGPKLVQPDADELVEEVAEGAADPAGQFGAATGALGDAFGQG